MNWIRVSFFPEEKSRTFTTGPTLFTSGKSTFSGTYSRNDVTPVTYERIISQCHRGSWNNPRSIRSGKDLGGNMSLYRERDISRFGSTWGVPFKWGAELGTQIHYGFQTGFTPGLIPVVATGSYLNAYGTSAVAAVLPTNPASGLAQALAELKQDGLPKLPGSSMRDRTNLSRKAGHEFLNIEFGWLPLVSDVQDFCYAVKHSRSLIEQYLRDSDRKIRRRHSRPTFRETRITEGGGFVSPVLGNIAAKGSVSETMTTDLWFSGAFRYHVPVDSDFMGRLLRYESLANHLLGTRITPELLWELAPWSWAIDWFTNAGDVIHNISSLGADGLVMQYGYAMREMRNLVQYRQTTIPSSGYPGGQTVGLDTEIVYKQRVRANPYGFGIDDLSLTSKQLAILAALGLSKGGRNP